MATDKSFSTRLRKLASDKKIFQSDLVAALGKSRSTISKWWNGEIVPGPKNISILADYFDCDAEWLATGKEEVKRGGGMVANGNGIIQAGKNIHGAPAVKQMATESRPRLGKNLVELDDDELELVNLLREVGGKMTLRKFITELHRIKKLLDDEI